MFPPLMGSPGRLFKASPGKAFFLRIALIRKLHPNRRGGGGVDNIWGYGGISPHLCNPLNTCVTIKNSEEPLKGTLT